MPRKIKIPTADYEGDLQVAKQHGLIDDDGYIEVEIEDENQLRYGLTLDEMKALGTYNAERYRGLVHTAAYDVRMAHLQAKFDLAKAKEDD